MMRFSCFVLLLCAVSATRHVVNIVLDPYEDYYIEAETVQVPGRIDFRHLTFSVSSTNTNGVTVYGTSAYNTDNGGYNDDGGNVTDDAVNNDDGGTNYYQGESVLIETVVIECGDLDKSTCLQQYDGIGEQINGKLYICCTEEALAAGACEEQGRLILNDYFDGKSLYLELAPGKSGNLADKFVYPQGTGSNAVLFVNCNEEYSISVTGSLGFKSSYGYLTVVSWRFSWIAHAMTLITGGALAWFLRQRRTRPIDHVITVTLLLAFLESFIHSFYFIVFNVSGFEPNGINAVRVLLRGCKYGIGHTLILLTAFGWEQHEDNTNLIPLYTICCLGMVYTLILVIPSLRHPAVVGEVLGFMFFVWAVKATTRMIDRFKLDKEKMDRFALLRGVYAFSLLLSVALFITYWIKWSKTSNEDDLETLHRGIYVIRQSVFLCVIFSIGIILRPLSEPLLKDFDDPVVTLEDDKEDSSSSSESEEEIA